MPHFCSTLKDFLWETHPLRIE